MYQVISKHANTAWKLRTPSTLHEWQEATRTRCHARWEASPRQPLLRVRRTFGVRAVQRSTCEQRARSRSASAGFRRALRSAFGKRARFSPCFGARGRVQSDAVHDCTDSACASCVQTLNASSPPFLPVPEQQKFQNFVLQTMAQAEQVLSVTGPALGRIWDARRGRVQHNSVRARLCARGSADRAALRNAALQLHHSAWRGAQARVHGRLGFACCGMPKCWRSRAL